MDESVGSIPSIVHLVIFPIEGTIQPKLAVVPQGLLCFVCGENKGIATMLLCDTSILTRLVHGIFDTTPNFISHWKLDLLLLPMVF